MSNNKAKKKKLRSRFLYSLFKKLYPYKVYGAENMIDGGAVVVCNHFRFIDCLYLYDIINSDCAMLCKKEVFDNKFVASIINDFGAIPIDREAPSISSLMSCLKILKVEKKLALFPEGTRNKTKTSNLQPIKDGAGIFAVKAKKPIIPIMMLKRAKIFRKTKIIVGKPFYLDEFYGSKCAEEDIAKMNKIIFDKMNEIHNELRQIAGKNKK